MTFAVSSAEGTSTIGRVNGARALVEAAAQLGVDTCFANPGTTEVHLVDALEQHGGIRPVLGLFEGVCSGAADGYARMTGRAAMTLVHLGPGLANAAANLHNADKARSPVLNVVGDHATRHLNSGSFLTLDIAALAAPVSTFVRQTRARADVVRDLTAAHHAAVQQGGVSTLVVPTDVQWEDADDPVQVTGRLEPSFPRTYAPELAAAAAIALRGDSSALLLGGEGLLERGLAVAARIQAATGCRVLSNRQPARIDSSPEVVAVERLGYFPEAATAQLKDLRQVVLAGAEPPVALFAYRFGPTQLFGPQIATSRLARHEDDVVAALENLADLLGAPAAAVPPTDPARRPAPVSGRLTSQNLGRALAAVVPDGAVYVDETITSAPDFFEQAAGRFPFSYLSLTGGAIGIGAPLAAGAALAVPDRPVVSVQGDGSAMYTLQALWTHARERLDVTTVICANRQYRILGVEHARAELPQPTGPVAALTELTDPELDWCALATGMGVPSSRAGDGRQLGVQLARATATPGPHLIELEVD